jgi:hypothetical protein
MQTTFIDRSGHPGYRERIAPSRPAATLLVAGGVVPGLVIWALAGFPPLLFHTTVLVTTVLIGVVALLPRTRLEIAEGAIHVTGAPATVVAVDDIRWVSSLSGSTLRRERLRRGRRRGGLVLSPAALRVVGGDGAGEFDRLVPTCRPLEVIGRLAAQRTHPVPIAVVPAWSPHHVPLPVAPAWGAGHG